MNATATLPLLLLSAIVAWLVVDRAQTRRRLTAERAATTAVLAAHQARMETLERTVTALGEDVGHEQAVAGMVERRLTLAVPPTPVMEPRRRLRIVPALLLLAALTAGGLVGWSTDQGREHQASPGLAPSMPRQDTTTLVDAPDRQPDPAPADDTDVDAGDGEGETAGPVPTSPAVPVTAVSVPPSSDPAPVTTPSVAVPDTSPTTTAPEPEPVPEETDGPEQPGLVSLCVDVTLLGRDVISTCPDRDEQDWRDER